MQGSIISITFGKALICRNLHGLEGEGRYVGAESEAENVIHPAVRDKLSRGWRTARDRDEWRPVCRVGSCKAGVGAVRRVKSYPTSISLPYPGAWPHWDGS